MSTLTWLKVQPFEFGSVQTFRDLIPLKTRCQAPSTHMMRSWALIGADDGRQILTVSGVSINLGPNNHHHPLPSLPPQERPSSLPGPFLSARSKMEAVIKDSPAPVDPMVYRDLLIFEESLRSQYTYLQHRRRKYLGISSHPLFAHPCSFAHSGYLVFIFVLVLWLAYFAYGTLVSPSQVLSPHHLP